MRKSNVGVQNFELLQGKNRLEKAGVCKFGG